MSDPSPLLTAIYPAMMGIALIAVSALGCRMRGYHRQLVGLEMRVGALETLRPVPAPAPVPVYQMPPPQPSAPPMMDPTPPPAHIAVGMPTVAAVSQIQRYTGYI